MLLKKFKEILLVIAASALILFVFIKPLNVADNNFTDLEFKIRGEIKTDSAIKIIYIDNAIMDSLGSVPLKWIYYTRLINALSKLNAKAIGIDMIFDKNSPDYPAQASWLVNSVRKNGKVCVGGLFNKLGKKESIITSRKDFPIKTKKMKLKSGMDNFLYGKRLNIPFPWLMKNSAGFGHLNFYNDLAIREIPLFVNNADAGYIKKGQPVPSLTIELLRVYFKLPKDSIIINDKSVQIRNGDKSITIPANNGKMIINYFGGLETLNMFSITSFLKYYDAYIRKQKQGNIIKQFKNSLVLIGSMAEHSSQFTSTPFSAKFPVVGVHAFILNTILNKQFLRKIPSLYSFIFSILIAVLIFSFLFNNKMKIAASIAISLSLIVVYLFISSILFSYNIILPLQPVVISVFAIIGGTAKQMNIITSRIEYSEKEKENIQAKLKESDGEIQHLQSELKNLKNSKVIETNKTLFDFEKTDTNNIYKFENKWKDRYKEFQGIVYSSSEKMEKVVELIQKIAPTDATVLILGESGTGKEVAANAIHNLSNRRNNKFVALNCGAIPETLLESELFGYEKGAYTGASKDKKGLFEVADNGTIFLDEITETSELFQTKLLRVLQYGEFNRVGSTEIKKVKIRILAASNKQIDDLVKQGKFRLDIFYRLNVIRIYIPPLRERKNDIPILTRYLLNKEGGENMTISESAMDAFINYNWPGNIRQLENFIKRAVIFAKTENQNTIKLKYLPSEILENKNGKNDLETRIIYSMRERKFTRNSINETAKNLGDLHRSTVAEYLKGICFKEYCNNNFNISSTVKSIGDTDDEDTLKRIEKKLNKYITNLLEFVNGEEPSENLKQALQIKYKKMPSKYYTYLEKITIAVTNNKNLLKEKLK